MTKLRPGTYCISSLAEGVRAHLVCGLPGAQWEEIGFWRWERALGDERRMPARRKVFWTSGRVPRRLAGTETPSAWFPIRPLRATPSQPRQRNETAEEDAQAPLSLRQCEARVMLAWRVDRALPDRERSQLRVRSGWPETGYEPGDVPPQISTRWRPRPADVDDYLIVMGWIARLERVERRTLFLRSLGLTFRSIAERIGGKHDEHGARRVYQRALDRVRSLAGESGKGGRTRTARAGARPCGARHDGGGGDRGQRA